MRVCVRVSISQHHIQEPIGEQEEEEEAATAERKEELKQTDFFASNRRTTSVKYRSSRAEHRGREDFQILLQEGRNFPSVFNPLEKTLPVSAEFTHRAAAKQQQQYRWR